VGGETRGYWIRAVDRMTAQQKLTTALLAAKLPKEALEPLTMQSPLAEVAVPANPSRPEDSRRSNQKPMNRPPYARLLAERDGRGPRIPRISPHDAERVRPETLPNATRAYPRIGRLSDLGIVGAYDKRIPRGRLASRKLRTSQPVSRP
jgi:hypothetical protein